jgi:cell division protein ZapA
VSRPTDRPRHTVTVTIADERHVLRSDAAPEYTHAVAAHVDRTVRALGDAAPLQAHRTAILAALSITDELFRTRQELEQLREAIASRGAALADRLEAASRAKLPAPPTTEADAGAGDQLDLEVPETPR